MMIPLLFAPEDLPKWEVLPWIDLKGVPFLPKIEVGVLVDPLSIILANVVAIISLLIMVYSLGRKGTPFRSIHGRTSHLGRSSGANSSGIIIAAIAAPRNEKRTAP
jgi:formate hydrogenlyase subunit 3/multisubunit Na+/H+ antiporter MnhD subunit